MRSSGAAGERGGATEAARPPAVLPGGARDLLERGSTSAGKLPRSARDDGGWARGAAWHLWLDLDPRPGALNMAIDQALLERAGRLGERRLRLYGWQPHCLSFGRHERVLRRYDRDRIGAMGLDAVRRPSGGRAVWHAEELTYAVAVPAAELPGVRAAYLEIHRMLLDALRSLGIDAAMAPECRVPGIDTGACFATPVGGEIVVGGRKVVGSAQVREGGGLLQHGSILLRDDQAMVRAVTLGGAPPDGSAPLEQLIGVALPAAELAAAIAGAAAARWGGDWTREGDSALLPEARIHQARFSSADWTWRA
jgi:lipoate-protein ligase A